MSSSTLSSTSATPQAQSHSASSPKQCTSPAKVATHSRPRTPCAKSPSPPSTTVSSASNSNSLGKSSNVSETVRSPVRHATARGCIQHLPYKPSRPPPHSYARQHEFPPFPPLARHPVLPFLTTAFSNTQDLQTTPPSSKSRPTPAPRVNPTGRYTQSTVSTIPTMDVSKNDPTVLFIRPPLVVPFLQNNDPSIDPSCIGGSTIDGELIPGTPLTYAILHTHRNWFLDAEDFRKDNPNRIDYPHDLEPPRGWAPLSECTGVGAANRCKQAREKKAKNNEIRTKGSYAHSDLIQNDVTTEFGPSDDCHEKTVLRCTFCRREYHGPNAKSMWRRHVFDKHKVAMKNRREGSAGMAPRMSHMHKKPKVKAADPSGAALNLNSQTQTLTLDLTNEENIIRLLERVVSGDVDIDLPTPLLNTSGNGSVFSLEAITLALRKSGVPLTIGGERTEPVPLAVPASGTDNNYPAVIVSKFSSEAPELVEAETETRPLPANVSRDGPSPTISGGPADAWVNSSKARIPDTSPRPVREVDNTTVSRGRKRKADAVRNNTIPPSFERTPLKDNTVLDRSVHNQGSRAVFGTPGKDRWKRNTLAQTPGEPKLSPESLDGTPSPRHPYTPVKPPTALRSRALATTGEESYLTLIVSSPATASPGRGSGRIPLTSPFVSHHPTKRNDGGYRSTSGDTFRNFNASSPRYPLEYNTQDVQSSSSVSAFDAIPLELDNLVPAYWTPPSLRSPPPVPKLDSRSISRASSIGDDGLGPSQEALHDDKDTKLRYPDCSSPSERLQSCSQNSLEDFDMEVYLDLEDAGPVSQADLPSSPYKQTTARGLQFSKEYGLLSPAEVERIVGNAHPSFTEEVRSSKRRRVEVL